MVNTNPSFISSMVFAIFCTLQLLTIAKSKATQVYPNDTLPPDISAKIQSDPSSIALAASDYGDMIHISPVGVFNPLSIDDIVALIRFNYNSSSPFLVAARGKGHSVMGQTMVKNGYVINMTSLGNNGVGIRVSSSPSLGSYVDAGGDQLWIDVLNASLEQGLSPVSWTDFLHLSVGGTLSNAGISGQTFLHGPQIRNVLELDVVTGKGELLTCSKDQNPELFYAVLGGLGQFGIITRARIHLEPAPIRVKYVGMLYDNFSTFSADQEHLISITGFNYVEGSVLLDKSYVDEWISSFSPSVQPTINSSVDVFYAIEAVKYYDDKTAKTIDEELKTLLSGLSFLPGISYVKDETYVEFLTRVPDGPWTATHPWLNLFIPKSNIQVFDSAVFHNILLNPLVKNSSSLILLYPMNRNRWDDRMSTVIPDEEIFYTVGLLLSEGPNNEQISEKQNKRILEFCRTSNIVCKQYLPHYETKEDWKAQFGAKWTTFQERKIKFDPKATLSPGQRIFNSIQYRKDRI